MKDNFEQQLKNVRNIKLSETEKRDLKMEIDAHARTQDVRNDNRVRQDGYKRSTFVLQVLTKQKYYMTGLAVALMLLVGGGTSFAAQDALPGDFLYPVKTEVNERVEGAFAFGAEAEAEFESDLAERRLTEATKLAARGELNADTRAQIENNFDAHVQEALARAESLSGKAKADIATRIQSRIESALSAHADVLAVAQGEADGGIATVSTQAQESADAAMTAQSSARADAQAFVSNIRARINDAVEARVSTESQLNAEGETGIENAAKRMKAAAKEKLEAIARILDSGNIEADISAKVTSYVDESNRLLAEGETDMENGDVRAGYRHFVEAYQLANRIHVFLNAHINSGFRLANINIFAHGSDGSESSASMMMGVGKNDEREKGKGADSEVRGEGEMTACTMDAKQCPDGSYVGRSGPNCTFDPCPGETENKEDTDESSSDQATEDKERQEQSERNIEIDARTDTRGEVSTGETEVQTRSETRIQFGF